MLDVGATLAAALEDRYTIEQELGRGGMAFVYLAHDVKHGRPVAIKVLRPEIATSIGAERFLREIETVASLTHPYILPLHDSGQAGGLLYYVMPYVAGETLRARLQREGQLGVEDALSIARQVGAALAHAHAVGIVHRDIKPENILFEGGVAIVADFGISRAISSAGSDRLTEPGITIGTLAYVSPEQAAGDDRVDGRSDQYALACVLYEMLAGEPPFTGATPQSVIAKHLQEPAPSVRVLRSTVPQQVADAIRTALQKTPADRFRGMREFTDALGQMITGPYPRGTRPATPRRWVYAIPLLAVVILLAALMPRWLSHGALSQRQYLLGTVGAEDVSDAPRTTRWELALQSALVQLPDVELTEPYRVNDHLLRAGGPPGEIGGWFDVAKDLKAGRLLVSRWLDSSSVVLELYDVRRRTTVSQTRADVSQGLDAAAVRAVERLYQLRPGLLAIGPGTNEPARRAFVSGHEALKSWNLRGAKESFEEAVALDPSDAESHFWLATVKLWAGDPAAEWAASARRAGVAVKELRDDHEREEALALRAIAEGRFLEACRRYGSLVAADSQSFSAWLGLAECTARDDGVVPDSASPSGFSFRASRSAAVAAYEHALEQVPSFSFQFGPFERLNSVLVVEPGRLRRGTLVGPESMLFAAYPSLLGDTVAYIPWPLAQILAGETPSPEGQDRAIAINRGRLLRIVRKWVQAFPDSSRAHLALARSLELQGWLDGGQGTGRSALAAAATARALARNRADSIATAQVEARVLLKLQRFSEARKLALGLLRHFPQPSPAEANELGGLAALVGKPSLAASLGAISARVYADNDRGRYERVALPVLEGWQRFMAWGAFGMPADSILVASARLDTLLQVYEAPERVKRLACDVVWYPRSLAFADLRETTPRGPCWGGNTLLDVQWRFAHGDTAGTRQALQQLHGLRTGTAPGEVALQNVYQEAWLLLQIGDSTAAAEYLDRSLAALQALRTSVVTEVPQAASLVRAMALRAELADRTGQDAVAREWATRVVELWEDGDEFVRPLVDRMRGIAARG